MASPVGTLRTAAAAVPGAIGLSSSSVSRTFTRASAQQLQALQDRDLTPLDIMAILLDGKPLRT